MSNQSNTPPQASYILRICGGIYLMYLAWDVRGAVASNPLFLIPIAVFAIVGAVLLGHSLWVLARHKYFRKDPSETESTEDWEDESDE